MVTASLSAKAVPSYTKPPTVAIRFRLLRDGEVTPSEKFLRLYKSWEEISQLDLVFWVPSGGSEYSLFQEVDLATLQSIEWLAVGRDDAAPRRARAAYLSLTAGGTYTFDIANSEGGGQQGEPASVNARVRVERADASREVVVLERPADGQWRLAGYGPTPDGEGVIDLRVVGGDVYALSVDDCGVAFVANLAVQAGQRIRPSQYAGWVYEITEAGTLPSTEPAWWPAVGDNASRPLGTARAVARRYFQPIALGPGPVEVI